MRARSAVIKRISTYSRMSSSAGNEKFSGHAYLSANRSKAASGAPVPTLSLSQRLSGDGCWARGIVLGPCKASTRKEVRQLLSAATHSAAGDEKGVSPEARVGWS